VIKASLAEMVEMDHLERWALEGVRVSRDDLVFVAAMATVSSESEVLWAAKVLQACVEHEAALRHRLMRPRSSDA
jgi:hypothetical protein